MSDPELDEFEDDQTEQHKQTALQQEVGRLSRALTGERAKRVDLEAAIQRAAEASFATIAPLRLPTPHPAGKRRKIAEIAYVHCADWHLGFDPITVTGKRVEAYRDKIISITNIARADHPVDEAHIPFMGDICHGEQIYPSSPYEQDASLIDQAVTDGADLVCGFLTDLLCEFKHLHVPWLAGNHGWLGPRKGGTYDPDSNLDRAMGLIVERRLQAARLGDRISFDIPRARRNQFGSMTVDRIGTWGVLLLHGHLMKGGSSYGGLPFYGFNRKGLSLGHLGDHGTLPPFNDISMGHYHQVFSIPVMSHQLRGCGTLQSETSFEVETLAAFSRPAQLIVFVHPENGVTAEYKVPL